MEKRKKRYKGKWCEATNGLEKEGMVKEVIYMLRCLLYFKMINGKGQKEADGNWTNGGNSVKWQIFKQWYLWFENYRGKQSWKVSNCTTTTMWRNRIRWVGKREAFGYWYWTNEWMGGKLLIIEREVRGWKRDVDSDCYWGKVTNGRDVTVMKIDRYVEKRKVMVKEVI